MEIVKFDKVSRVYTSGDHELRALDNVDMTLDEGKFVVILGPSGAGKSTLLNLLGGLDSPTDGKYLLRAKIFQSSRTTSLRTTARRLLVLFFSFITLCPPSRCMRMSRL